MRKGDATRALKSKVAEMERARRAESDEHRDDHRRLMHMLNGALVAHQPGLAQVRPEHTDPETYRDIQDTIAWARGDFAEADRLADLDPNKHVPPPVDAFRGADALGARDTGTSLRGDRGPRQVKRKPCRLQTGRVFRPRWDAPAGFSRSRLRCREWGPNRKAVVQARRTPSLSRYRGLGWPLVHRDDPGGA